MNVIFDLGNVVNRWQPEQALAAHCGGESAAREAMERHSFFSWNAEQDRGRSFEDGFAAAPNADAEALYRAYLSNIARAHDSLIDGTVDVLNELDGKGTPLYAITNAPAEAAATMRAQHTVMALFRDIIVSANEGAVKPDAAIFATLCERHNLARDQCIFIDDTLRNVEGAQVFGMDAIHFTDPVALRSDLRERGML
ncbi:MAG: HAD family phosphatase [Pseudomonadota bacterium]